MKRPLTLLLSAIAVFACGAVAYAASNLEIPNGGFEKGNFSGWQHVATGGGEAFVYTAAQRDRVPVATPPQLPKPFGKYAAATAQADPSVSYFTRVLHVPHDATTLTFKYFWNNLVPEGGTPASAPAPRAVPVGEWVFPGSWVLDAGDIQYFKIDLIKASASSSTTAKSDILAKIFAPKAGSTKRFSSGWVDGSVNVSRFHGKKVKFRFVQADSIGPLNVALDELSFNAPKPPTG